MTRNDALPLGRLALDLRTRTQPLGARVFAALIEMAERAVAQLHKSSLTPMAALGRLRGTGRGISSTALFDTLDREHPIELVAPFEGSTKVSGAVWRGDQIVGQSSLAAIAKLVWSVGADDLPMHVHDHSDRFIMVRRGRGWFHVTDEQCESFSGRAVRSIPARERDILLFTRGVVHTFSTADEPMELWSCQLPFVPFDHPDQYRIPQHRWTAATHRDNYPVTIACDAAWTVLARQSTPNLIASCMTPVGS